MKDGIIYFEHKGNPRRSIYWWSNGTENNTDYFIYWVSNYYSINKAYAKSQLKVMVF